ncbi:hypothetical protein TSTA_081550 [Talaromyces stipitatus ATCC 10500]|uniref:Uncharacterized protein n=1 Tax=Talaromyces stipitatus (strain ATCC 10500 / CBS 375.48 / QM 6759 / NRRL 1006) TaxID=441959 RepID=B8LZZ0_TALSN|nr:uncharacterized protein TSTA_081550 [Talaromyces stipitatus ATCC 10500]EED20922.1 hypothetical protein TSTA_081550 [Talaromyces stipitatus ATCC 10500]
MARNRSEPNKRSLQTALQETTTAATIRAAKGQKIFSPIAIFLDKHRNQTAGLSPHLQRTLAALSDDLATMAQHHFNAYITKPATATQQTKPPMKKSISDAKQSLPDHHLFMCLPPDHAARKMDAYAIFSSLQSQLGINSNALKEVQIIKTGFALCPASMEALSTLKAQKEVISTYFGDCQIEWSSH